MANERGKGRYCAFIDRMTDERLIFLISDVALGIDILQHAADCTTCGARVEKAVKQDYERLPEETKMRYEEVVAARLRIN
jgi:uncharacterized protein with PIN domain